MSATPEFKREIVLVPDRLDADDVPRLAFALHADLARVGEGWRVFRRPETVKALRKDDRAWVATQIATALARVDALCRPYATSPEKGPVTALDAARARIEARAEAERLAGRPGGSVDTSGSEALEVTPASRLLASLVREDRGGSLRDVPPGRLAVFSNVPSDFERPLADGHAPLVAYAAAQERFAAWGQAAVAADRIPERYRWAFPTGDFVPGSRTIQLVVNRQSAEPVFGLSVYDPTGRFEALGTLAVRGQADLYTPSAPAKPVLGSAPLSAAARAAIAASTGKVAATIDPAERDPLDVYVREALTLWAAAKGYSRVEACVPDDLLAAVPPCARGRRSISTPSRRPFGAPTAKPRSSAERSWCALRTRFRRRRRG